MTFFSSLNILINQRVESPTWKMGMRPPHMTAQLTIYSQLMSPYYTKS